MDNDPWLRRWLPLIRQRAGTMPILELGCGSGIDTEIVVRDGQHVIAIDSSPDKISEAQTRVPTAEFYCQDFRAAFPLNAKNVGVVLASLSLHYFPWNETLEMVERIRWTLRPNGALLCRLNSTNDHHHGATGHPQIAENFYSVKGQTKRFFNRETVDQLFAENWHPFSIQEMVINRFKNPKSVWEVIVERIK